MSALPACALRPLARPPSAAKAATPTAVVEGFSALFRGAGFLLSTRGVKRWLLPPLVVTTAIFLGVFLWTWSWFGVLVESFLPGEVSLSDWGPELVPDRRRMGDQRGARGARDARG